MVFHFSILRETQSVPVQQNRIMHLYLNVCLRERKRAEKREGYLSQSTAGSSGGCLEEAACAWGCGAWEGCHSGLECGCSAGGRKDFGRNRSPVRWVPEEHSLWVLKKKSEDGVSKFNS